MAIRDRITVTTKLGTVIAISATRAGGSVDYSTNREWVTVEEYAADVKRTPIREAKVAVTEVVSIVKDSEPRTAAPKTRQRKPKPE